MIGAIPDGLMHGDTTQKLTAKTFKVISGAQEMDQKETDELFNKFASAIAQHSDRSANRFLGVKTGDWVKWVVGASVLAVGYWLSHNKDLDSRFFDRPTKKDVQSRFEKMESKIGTISDRSIRTDENVRRILRKMENF